ncbi:hypothetical protein V1505DRAFT_375618, partial [Lipomyces doorenjongii]
MFYLVICCMFFLNHCCTFGDCVLRFTPVHSNLTDIAPAVLPMCFEFQTSYSCRGNGSRRRRRDEHYIFPADSV